MSPSPELLRDCDMVAGALGVTLRLDAEGIPIPIGEKEDRGHVYVVWVGRGIGLFYNWGLTHAMVCGFSGSAHKKYNSLEGALQGWIEGPTQMAGSWRIPQPCPPILTERSRPEAKLPQSPDQPHRSLPPEVSVLPAKAGPRALAIAAQTWAAQSEDAFWDNHNGNSHEPLSTSSPPPSPTPRAMPSPNVSSDSELSFCSLEAVRFASMLTDGTISPWTINTPPMSSPAAQSSTFSSPVGAHRRAPNSLNPPKLSQPTPTSPQVHSRINDERLERLARMNALAAKDRKCYVVVRGNRPGVYFTINMALEMLGGKPSMKLVRFFSLSDACWYFVQEYMEDRVGVPVLQEEEDGYGDEWKPAR
ncbi:hypothetical protein C8Q73DRAFT_637151 [Cubamyces lactineus]|nr:hypothetical protein C8Q73DRAFT_637151 [Cubamyces lactineus]